MTVNTRNKRFAFIIFGLLVISIFGFSWFSTTLANARNTPEMQALGGGPELIILAGDTPSTAKVAPPAKFLQGGPRTADIVVTYNGSWSAEAQNAFEYAVTIWETLIDSPVTIKVSADWDNLGAGVLGGASAYDYRENFANAPYSDTWYPYPLADKIAGTDLDPANPDIEASFNNAFSDWYFGTDNSPPANKYDFVSVVLHEIGHGLGFAGSMTIDSGNGICGGAGNGCWGYGTGQPFVYDRFTENGNGYLLITGFNNNSTQLAAQLTGAGGGVYFDSPNAVTANGGSPPKLYIPGSWQQGSSYSHLNDATFDGTSHALMTHSISNGEANHNPGTITLAMFEDMGWTLETAATPTPTPTNTSTPTNTPTPTATPSPDEAIIDPATGGTLTFTDYEGDQTTITVLSNTVTQTITLKYTPLGEQIPPEDQEFAGTAFTLDAYLTDTLIAGFVFSQPVTVRLEYSDSDVSRLSGEETIVLYVWDAGSSAWVDANTTCTPASSYERHPDQNWLSVPICHLSTFSLFGERGNVDINLPLILNSSGSVPTPTPTATPGGQWQTIVTQNFEGDFPGNWIVDDNGTTNGNYYWGKRGCQPYAGSYSGWMMGGGSTGSGTACGANYPNNFQSWMIYGPANLSDATDAEFTAKVWVNSELGWDGICLFASLNQMNFHGTCTSGNTGGWLDRTLDLANVPDLGNLIGQSQVWVAVYFVSNGSTNKSVGAYVDQVLLRKCTTGNCSATTLLNTPANGNFISQEDHQVWER